MSNKFIYTQERIPYAYLIGWSNLNMWYYGRRTAKQCHPSEFWVTYFTSSNHVKNFRKTFGEPDVIQIRKTFSNILTCKKWETKVLQKVLLSDSSKWLNKKAGDSKFDTTGFSNWLDNDGNIYHLKKTDPLIQQLSLKSIFSKINANSATYVNISDKSDVRRLKTDDPLVLNGQYISIVKGRRSTFKGKNHSNKTKSLIKERTLKRNLELFNAKDIYEMYDIIMNAVNQYNLQHSKINQYGKYNFTKITEILSPINNYGYQFFKSIVRMVENP